MNRSLFKSIVRQKCECHPYMVLVRNIKTLTYLPEYDDRYARKYKDWMLIGLAQNGPVKSCS